MYKMASSAVSGLARSSISLLSASRLPGSRPLPGASISQVTFAPKLFPTQRSGLVRPYATAAADESGKDTGADRSGTGDSGGRSHADGSSDVAVRGKGDQSFGLTRGRRGQGTDLTPFSFGPLFSFRGDRDLFNMMDDFFLTPSRFFDDAVRDILRDVAAPVAEALPRMEITEDDKEYKVQVGLPGLRKDEVDIKIEDSKRAHAPILHLTARHEQKEGDQVRFWEDVDTRLRLPEDADPEQVEAEVKDGLLTIHVKKSDKPHKEPEPKRIPIKG